jgi:hypothetical protein
MYKLLYQNKILILLGILTTVFFIYKITIKKEKKVNFSDSSELSSIIIESKSKNTSSILPDPRKRIKNIHNDIRYLQHLTNNKNDEQIKLITKYNQEPEDYFMELCKEKKIFFDKDKVTNLVDYLEKLSKSIKNKYKIPRPYILAKKLDVNINNLAKPSSFSYPSGKVFKSKMLSHYFSYIDPRYDYEFQQITKDIELACLYSGINTPFDIRGSLLLAQKIMEKKVLKKFI